MSIAKKALQLAGQIKYSSESGVHISADLFKDLKYDCQSNREYVLALGYAVHYLSSSYFGVNEDFKASLNVSMIMKGVNARPSDFSNMLARSSAKHCSNSITAILNGKVDLLNEGSEQAIGEFLYAIYYSSDNMTQALILRCYEIMDGTLAANDESFIGSGMSLADINIDYLEVAGLSAAW